MPTSSTRLPLGGSGLYMGEDGVSEDCIVTGNTETVCIVTWCIVEMCIVTVCVVTW